ncbi:MAG: hypothetical protein WBG46_02100 [Nonlabens sp.]
MYRYLILFGCFFLLASCEEASPDPRTDAEQPVEPIDNLVRLSQIIVTDPISNDTITEIQINYDMDDLITSITFAGSSDITYDFEYARNNRLTRFSKAENGTTSNYDLEYGDDEINLTTSQASSMETRVFEIDNQNRIFYTRSLSNDLLTGAKEYDYTANFNVDRISERDAFLNTIGYQDLTYFFNNNPFRDMNDVLRFIVFEEFIPYTRYLPDTLNEFGSTSGSLQLESSTIYDYELNEADFPMSRTVISDVNGFVTETLETFIYTDN